MKMNLKELQTAVNEVVNTVIENGEKPKDVEVGLHFNKADGGSIFTDTCIEVRWDGDITIEGCLITADLLRENE